MTQKATKQQFQVEPGQYFYMIDYHTKTLVETSPSIISWVGGNAIKVYPTTLIKHEDN